MDDQKNNGSDLSKIVEKAESLKSLLSDHKMVAPEADASATTQATADQAASEETTAPKRPLHIPSASIHQAPDKRQAVADLFAKAVDRSQKSQKEWMEEAVTARVEKEKAKLMEEQESRAEALRAEAEAKISEATQNREAVEKEMAELKEEAEAKAQSDAEARADLEAQLSEKDEQLSAAEAEKQAAEEKAEAEAKAWETARAEAEARAKAQDEALAALQARLEENEARLAALEAERSQLQQASTAVAAEAVSDDAPAVSELPQAPAAEENTAEAAESPLESEVAEEAAQATDNTEPEETASDFWEDDGEGLFESEDLPEETAEATEAMAPEASDAPEAAHAANHADLVTDHMAFRTYQPQESVALSENIPWVSPNTSEKRRERRLDWLEAESQNQAAEPEVPETQAAPADAEEPMDRKTEEDRDVLDVLRKLANAKPVPGEAGIAAAAEPAEAPPADGAVEDWLFEEDEILPDTDAAAEAALFETETLPETPAGDKTAEPAEAEADAVPEPEKDDFWQTESEPAADTVAMTEEAPDFWGSEAPEAGDDTLWNDAKPADEMAEASPAAEETTDLPAASDEVAEGFAIEDTQVLDSEAIDHFFAMSESDDEVPSILDEKAEEVRAAGAVNAAEAKTEAVSEDFDDLFEEGEAVDSAPAEPAPDASFEPAEAADGLFEMTKGKADEAKNAASDAFNDLFDASEADEELTKAIDRRAIHEKLTPSEQAVYDDLFSDDDADRDVLDEAMPEKPRRRGLFGRKR